ncbi:MAG: rod shape-determining protein MreC [Actinomycetota bacterium]
MLRLSERTRRVRILLIVLLITSIALVTIDVRSHGNGPLSKLGNAVASVLGPLQDGLSHITRPIGNFFAGFTEVGSLKAEIKRLQEEIALINTDRGTISSLMTENDELRKLLHLDTNLGFKTRAAEVIGRDPSNFEQALVIDAGTSKGIRKGMAVISAEGLVGRIVEVSRDTATVLLIVDARSSVAARLATSHEVGTLDGQGSGTLEFQLLDPYANVAAGDDVVTTGESGIFPPRIRIGKIIQVDATGGNPTRLTFVKPYVDFTSLDFVLVVTDPHATQIPDVIPTPTPTPTSTPSQSPAPRATPTKKAPSKPKPSAKPSPGASH